VNKSGNSQEKPANSASSERDFNVAKNKFTHKTSASQERT
jgi:hypothetical protein